MENFDFTLKVSSMAVSVMSVTMIAMILIVGLTYLYIRRAYPANYKGTFLGMATYFLGCLVLVSLVITGVRYAFSAMNVSENMQTAVTHIERVICLLIQSAIAIWVMEFSMGHFGWNQGESKFGNILAFGFGFILVDVLQWVVEIFINYWLPSFSINGIGLEAYYETLGEEKYATFIQECQYLFDYGPAHYVWLFLEEVTVVAFIMTVAVLVSMVVKKLVQKSFLAIAMGWYFVFYLPGMLNVMGALNSEFLVWFLELIITVAAVLFTWQVMKKLTPEDCEKMDEIRRGGVYEALFAPRRVKKENKNKTSITKAANANRSVQNKDGEN